MRAGGCTVQQALTPEAATLVKQAVNLARRRGHAQVTPLHVSSTMLSSSAGLLRAACLQSHSHPLQCKALELCFNVALNRLPPSAVSAPMLGAGVSSHHYDHHHHPPTLSNALVAAFKRAQAHQRRGSIESQQQPLLGVKIELEQLIISILDDPSVSRVMREAGFSSTQVKSNMELAVSSSPSSSPPRKSKLDAAIPRPAYPTPQQPQPQTRSSFFVHAKDEDLMCVIGAISGSKKRRSLVILGESLETSDGVVRGLIERLEKGSSQVPETLKNVKFINFPLHSLKNMPREEVDQKLVELKFHVNSFFHGGGREVGLYLGDLNWPAEITRGERSSGGENIRRSYYCPIMDHVVMEIRSMVFNGDNSNVNGRIWLLGIATYQTFMRCSAGYPSLSTLWDLQPLALPSGSLNLSLSFDSESKSQSISKASGDHGSFWSSMGDGSRGQLTCCADCSFNFENEARNLPKIGHSNLNSVASTLPSWLQQYKQDNPRTSDEQQECLQYRHLRRKWNTICCSSAHRSLQQQPSEITFNFSSVSPSYSISSDHTNLHQFKQKTWPLPSDQSKHPSISSRRNSTVEIINLEQRPSNPNSTSSASSSSSRGTLQMECSASRFKELSAENLKILCTALERTVPWQKDIIPEIASTILQCRSGMIYRRRKEQPFSGVQEVAKEETWLFFQGGDKEGKERVARELAYLIFGSHSSFISISDLNTFSSTRSSSSDDIIRHKRSRADQPISHCDQERRLFEVLCENPHRVVLMEDVESMDSRVQASISSAIERGKMKSCINGEEVGMSDAIIILSCESLDCRSRTCSPPAKCKKASDYEDHEKEELEASEKEVSSNCSFALDLNLSAEDEIDHLDEYNCSTTEDVKLLDLVDRSFFFKLHDDL